MIKVWQVIKPNLFMILKISTKKGFFMRISSELVKEFLDELKKNIEAERKRLTSGDEISLYTIEELSAVFRIKDNSETLYNIRFSLLGKEVYIMENLEVVLDLGDGDFPERNTYVIEDEGFILLIEKYLTWRLDALRFLNI